LDACFTLNVRKHRPGALGVQAPMSIAFSFS
jgi:hypothetical protein